MKPRCSVLNVLAIVTLTLLASHLACAQGQDTPSARNLAPNPSFEEGDASGPAAWEPRPDAHSVARYEWAEGVAHSGERSLLVESEGGSRYGDRWRAGQDRSMGLRPGTECTLSAWVRTDALDGQAYVQLYAIGIGGEILLQPTGPGVSGTQDWTEVAVTVTAPDEPCYVMPYVGLKGGGRAWFDDVRLTGIPGPPLPADMDETTYQARHFDERDGYEPATRGEWEVLQAPEGVERASATTVFHEATARWDVTLRYLDEPDGACTFRLLVNGEEVGSIVADETVDEDPGADVERTHTFEAVDIQRYSRITIAGEPDEGEYARFMAVTFTPVGRFEGELLGERELPPPNNLRVYQSPSERDEASRMLARQVGQMSAAAFAEITDEIEALQTPEQVRAYQQRVQERLPEIFGRWVGHEKTALNPQKVGEIELDFCTIEKVLIESEPGLLVPLNVYVPKGKPLPAPGICVTIGHAADGKGYQLYHELGLGLAEKGYVAVALDPLGQGERTYWWEPPEELGRRGGPVGQHHYELRRGFLVGRSLSGLRTRDTVRVVDYMLSRPEIIDPDRIGVSGNSGGGQMALLTIACHPAVRVCAAAHPGGSCENTYFGGKSYFDRMVISLIPPRPLIWIVGEDSGETHHERRRDWLQPLYEVFEAGDAQKLEWVEGVHDMKRPKREAAYEWLRRWLGMDAGREEGAIEALEPEELWCSETGLVETGPGGVMPWDLDTRLMREMAPKRPAPAEDADARSQFLGRRRQAVLEKLGLAPEAGRPAPKWRNAGVFEYPGLSVRKLAIESEEGIEVAALVIEPAIGASGPTIIHAAEDGKPGEFDAQALPFALALRGHRVVSVDVRGVGELDIEEGRVSRVVEYDAIQWRRDDFAIAYAGQGRTMMGARALDLLRVMDHLDAEARQPGRYVLAGEGLGGTWAMAAALADERVAGVATVGTLASWRLLIESKWNALRDYFWVPKALEVFDLPDLPGLIAPRPVAILNPVDQMLHPLSEEAAQDELAWAQSCYDAMGAGGRLVIRAERSAAEVVEAVEGLA
ncbi:MAG: prolyl oligopeptidase family serine peptidase, partial [Armatimonadota bacterium]